MGRKDQKGERKSTKDESLQMNRAEKRLARWCIPSVDGPVSSSMRKPSVSQPVQMVGEGPRNTLSKLCGERGGERERER